jgi:hypothetical protein
MKINNTEKGTGHRLPSLAKADDDHPVVGLQAWRHQYSPDFNLPLEFSTNINLAKHKRYHVNI